MLIYEREFGKVHFANIKGEEGEGSIRNLGLGSIVYDIDCWQTWLEYLSFCEGEKPRAIALDSQKALYDLVIDDRCPGRRPVGGEGDKNEWTEIHMEMNKAMTRFRHCADVILAVSIADMSKNMFKETETGGKLKPQLTPDLSGKMAYNCAGWYDLVGFLMADTTVSGVNRTVSFQQSSRWLARQRVPNEITEDIVIPHGAGGWKAIRDALDKAYKPQEKKQ